MERGTSAKNSGQTTDNSDAGNSRASKKSDGGTFAAATLGALTLVGGTIAYFREAGRAEDAAGGKPLSTEVFDTNFNIRTTVFCGGVFTVKEVYQPTSALMMIAALEGAPTSSFDFEFAVPSGGLQPDLQELDTALEYSIGRCKGKIDTVTFRGNLGDELLTQVLCKFQDFGVAPTFVSVRNGDYNGSCLRPLGGLDIKKLQLFEVQIADPIATQGLRGAGFSTVTVTSKSSIDLSFLKELSQLKYVQVSTPGVGAVEELLRNDRSWSSYGIHLLVACPSESDAARIEKAYTTSPPENQESVSLELIISSEPSAPIASAR